MRFAADDAVWDRFVPAFMLPYAIWTIYVHLLAWGHASFTTLLRGLPIVAALAIASTVGWFRLRDATSPGPAGDRVGVIAPAAAGVAIGALRFAPLVVLALAALWVALLSAGMPYPMFWWAALVATFAAWSRQLRGGTTPPASAATGNAAPWIVACVGVAAICTTLLANRSDADDALHLSIPATLLRLPGEPLLQHDTMYRLADVPLLLPFYRLSSYETLIAAVAATTGLDHLVVAYMLLPAFFAMFAVLAWVYLLRRTLPSRWTTVLPILFACVIALGEAHRAYGNFAFVRLFQGKAILATCAVPAIAGAALAYARRGGLRHWLLLFATQVAALGFAASAAFVAPAAAALGLAGGCMANRAHARRFVAGLLATAYPLAAAWFVAAGTRGQHVLAIVSPDPMPAVPDLLMQTWGPWSTPILLVALLAAWAFAHDRSHARYFSAGAFFFLLVVLDPYTTPFVARHYVGAQTYWRLTWALPLPFFLAAMIDGLLARALGARPKALAACCLATLASACLAFGWHACTLLRTNQVILGAPGLKVPPVEYGIALDVVRHVPESGTVLAPEEVASWLPIFVVHPELIGARHMYLSLAFDRAETAQRSNMMRYVAGAYSPPDARAWFAASLRRYRVTAVVVARAAPWSDEIGRDLAGAGWRRLQCGPYELLVRDDPATAPWMVCDATSILRQRQSGLAATAPGRR